MADPITIALATAVATGMASKISEHASEAVGEALKRLQRAVFKRFRGDDAAQEALDEARISPEDPAVMETLADLLERAADADPEIADLVDRLGSHVEQGGEGNVINQIHGDVSDRARVVQGRDFQGDIHL